MPAVKGYRLPGEGSSTAISVVTVIALFTLWWVATHLGWVRDLFLPTPERIVTAFVDAWKGDIQGGKPLTVRVTVPLPDRTGRPRAAPS